MAGLVGMKSQMDRTALQGLSKVASEQEANKRMNEQLEQAEKAQTLTTAAGGAMMGAQLASAMSVTGPVGAAIGLVGGALLGELF